MLIYVLFKRFIYIGENKIRIYGVEGERKNNVSYSDQTC